jgi:hypothetical protein
MASLTVRFKSGDVGEWELHDRADTNGIARMLVEAIARGSSVAFGAAAVNEGSPADYGRVGLNGRELAPWHIDGLVDDEALMGPWTEAQGHR